MSDQENSSNPLLPKPRIPSEIDGIQVNFCKNPKCPNFGIPPLQNTKGIAYNLTKTAAPGKKRSRDGYTVVGRGGGNGPRIECHDCLEKIPMKNNVAVKEELERMSAYLRAPDAKCCPTVSCKNHGIGVNTAGAYHSFGSTKAGSTRFRCKECGKTFSVPNKSILRQQKSHENKLIFGLLVNKSPLRRICEVAEIGIGTLYDKINFLHRQCLTFAGFHERRLPEMPFNRLSISVDRQDYTVNWLSSADRRNIVLHALGSADNRSGFVFGMHLNFEPSLNLASVGVDARLCGDYRLEPPFRKYARLWLLPDYIESAKRSRIKKVEQKEALDIKISKRYVESELREDIEAFEAHTAITKLPERGMQVHSEYTLYGHFFFLRHLLQNVKKIRFFMDQESGIRAACFSAFHKRIMDKRCDAFYVRINKDMTVNQKRLLVGEGSKILNGFRESNPYYQDLSDSALRVLMIEELIKARQFKVFEPFKDGYLCDPAPTINEPEKMVCYLTALDGDPYTPFDLARLFAGASLHGIDRFFMQVRRRLSLLERPIATSSNMGRKWYGYSPYRPDIIIKILDIYRTFYNYIHQGSDGKTPAMRLGLVNRPIKKEDVIYFMQKAV